jgi:penicillin-binding protein 1A
VKRFVTIILWFFALTAFLGACTGAYFWYIWSSNMPYIGSVKEYRPPIVTEVFSDDGEMIGQFWAEKRFVVTLDQVPQHLINAFLAAEDSRFFEHRGVDIASILRALYKNLTSGKIEQGGSTITQQVTRSLLLRNTKRTYRRKAREAILSVQLERNFPKEAILSLYLNEIYLGHGAYGVEAAARTYYDKPAKDLNLSEAALLAGLPQAPSRYSPVSHLDLAKDRQVYVLRRMLKEKYITLEQVKEALDAPLEIKAASENPFEKAPYYAEHVRRYLLEKYGQELLYRGGLRVHTSLDLSMQRAARDALNKGLTELDKREGYRGVLRHLTAEEITDFKSSALEEFSSMPPGIGSVVKGLVESIDDEGGEVTVWVGEGSGRLPLSMMNWARRPNPEVAYYAQRVKKASEVLKKGDVVMVRLEKEDKEPFSWEVSLEQIPEVQGALFCMASGTGEVKAMVGGLDFAVSQYNRAIQSRRQPGSAFKPLIYAAALDWGMSPSEIIVDTAYISDKNPEEEIWKPKNYKGKFFGPTLFRTALTNSRNVITVKILKKIGVRYAIEYAREMGIESVLSPDLSLALGSTGVSLMEITRAYAVFASGGMLVKPIFIKRVLDRSGQIIEENQPELREVISKETAYVMTDLLKAVIQEGTGWRIKQLKRPAAGKTGTTNNLVDAWFMGYTPEFVTGVWVGNDDRKVMGKGETGSRAASPIWLYFMSDALKGRQIVDFHVPDGVVFAKIDVKTGLLASSYSEDTIFQAFKEGTEPKEYSPRPASPKSGQFFQYDMDDD